MTEEAVMQSIRERLAPEFDIERIVLFGSRARGDARWESDWDVLVITPTTLPFIERQGRALVLMGLRDFALDLLIYTKEEAESAARIPGSAVYWAEREGRLCYAK